MRFSTITAALGAAFALVMAGPVAAQANGPAVFSTFRDACMAGNADAAYAVNKLRNQGWVAAPDELAEPMRRETSADAAVLLNFDIDTLAMKAASDLGMAMAMIGTAPSDAFGVPMTGPFCALVPFEADPQALRNALAGHFGFQPYVEDGMTLWIFSQARGGAVVPVPDMDALVDAAYLQRMRETPHYIAGVAEDDDMTIIMFMRLVP